MLKNVEEQWLSDFHYGCNPLSAKDTRELDEVIDQVMKKGLDYNNPNHKKYAQLASWLAELKVRRYAPPQTQPKIHQDQNGNELNTLEKWECVLSHGFRNFLKVNSQTSNKRDIAKSLQHLKQLCQSMQHWLGC